MVRKIWKVCVGVLNIGSGVQGSGFRVQGTKQKKRVKSKE
jgi:hypothetical protein